MASRGFTLKLPTNLAVTYSLRNKAWIIRYNIISFPIIQTLVSFQQLEMQHAEHKLWQRILNTFPRQLMSCGTYPLSKCGIQQTNKSENALSHEKIKKVYQEKWFI